MLTLAVVTASAQRISCIRPSERAGTRQQYVLPEVKTSSVPSCPVIYIVRYADGTIRKVIR